MTRSDWSPLIPGALGLALMFAPACSGETPSTPAAVSAPTTAPAETRPASASPVVTVKKTPG